MRVERSERRVRGKWRVRRGGWGGRAAAGSEAVNVEGRVK